MKISTSVGIVDEKIKVNVSGEDEVKIIVNKDKIEVGNMHYNPQTNKVHKIEITFNK